ALRRDLHLCNALPQWDEVEPTRSVEDSAFPRRTVGTRTHPMPWSDLTLILVSGEDSPRSVFPCRRHQREDVMKTLLVTVANQTKYLIAAGMMAICLQPTGPGGAAFGQEPRPDRRDPIEAIVNAKNSTEAKSGYESLFKGSDSKRIRALKSHPEVGIGLMAGWEEVRRSVPWWRRESKPLDSKTLDGFLDFAEGRLNAK